MTKLTDILEIDGKEVSVLEEVKRIHGFKAPIPYGLDIDPEERAKRQWARKRNKLNNAR